MQRAQLFSPEALKAIVGHIGAEDSVKVARADRDLLQSLRPLDVTAYLRTHGWHQDARLGDRGAVWVSPGAAAELLRAARPRDWRLHVQNG